MLRTRRRKPLEVSQIHFSEFQIFSRPNHSSDSAMEYTSALGIARLITSAGSNRGVMLLADNPAQAVGFWSADRLMFSDPRSDPLRPCSLSPLRQRRPRFADYVCGGLLSFADFLPYVLRNVTGVAKDCSVVGAYHHFGIFDSIESFTGHTSRSG